MSEALAIHGGTPVRTRAWPCWPEWGEPEEGALRRVLGSGSWGGFPSPNTEALAFAEEFGSYLQAAHVAPCANGTAALVLALQAARLSPGAEVVTTAYSFVATAGAIAQVGCIPVPVDVLPDTYCLDPDRVEDAITDRTEAIVAVHLACAMADLDRLCDIAQRRGLVLIEDCAHAHGARWRERAAGTWGALGTFSMQSTKLLTAGEGGAVTARDELAAQRVQSLANCGRKEPGRDAFPETLLGHNLRMSEWQAAILREQLRRLPEQHARRALRVATLESALAEIPGLVPLARDPRVTSPTCYQFIVRYDAASFAGVPRDHALLALQAEGIPAVGRFYLPLDEDPLFALDPHTNPAVRAGLAWSKPELPVTRRAAHDEAIWLPHELFLGDRTDVGDLVAAFAKLHAGAGSLRDRPPETAACA